MQTIDNSVYIDNEQLVEYKYSLALCVDAICQNNDEISAIQILLSSLTNKTKKNERDLAHKTACIRAIRKINTQRIKSETISALCEDEKDENK
jgi:hypothetical protein